MNAERNRPVPIEFCQAQTPPGHSPEQQFSRKLQSPPHGIFTCRLKPVPVEATSFPQPAKQIHLEKEKRHGIFGRSRKDRRGCGCR
jgi:hypothetical protein